METKAFEVRDRMTFIPVMATAMIPNPSRTDEFVSERFLLKRCGYDVEVMPAYAAVAVYVVKLDGSKGTIHAFEWDQPGGTLRVAHEYIEKNWALLRSGDVIDAELIRGETQTPKRSDRYGDVRQTERVQ